MKCNKPFILLFIITILFASCGPKKFVAEKGLTAKNAKAVVQIHNSLSPKFETINGKLKASFDDGNISQSLSITYRIEKDKTIWMSAKAVGFFTVAKLKITPNRVQFYEKIQGQYFDGDFQLISDLLGVEIDFEGLQNLLFAQSVYPLVASKSNTRADGNSFIFSNKINDFLTQEAKIYTKNFSLQEQLVKHTNQLDFLSIKYAEFQEINKRPFPKEINILAKQNKDIIKLNLEYRNIKVDEELSFPFKIPSNYSEITF